MMVYLLLVITVFLAITSGFMMWRACGRKFHIAWPGMLLSGFLAGFIYLYGTWVFLSVYTKYVFGICFVALLMVRLAMKKTGNQSKGSWPGIVANLFFAIVFGALCVLYFTGTTGKPYGVAHLALPFKKGNYFVFQGGKGLPTNVFHYKLRGAVYAMDIVKLNDAGNRAKHIFSTRLEDYAIFDDTIYSPCNGRVIKTRDDNKDNTPPHLLRGAGSLNMVLIETDSSYVFMGHLKQGSIVVKEGDTVITGQPLGSAGNSGFSLEPHLHIQVHAKTNKSIPWYKEKPLWIEFGGKSYLLFDVIRAGGS